MSYLGTVGFITGNLVTSSNVISKIMEAQRSGSIPTNVTNCITGIPNHIKMTLSNNVLTIHKGTVVAIPNSNAEDKFIYKTLERDYVYPKLGTVTGGDLCLLYNADVDDFQQCAIQNIISTGSLSDSHIKTAHQICMISSNGTFTFYGRRAPNHANGEPNTEALGGTSWTKAPFSLPIGIVTRGDDGSPTKIVENFSVCGGFTHCYFMREGVKGLIPDGFNADGTFKNIEYTSPTTWVIATTTNSTRYQALSAYGGYSSSKFVVETYNDINKSTSGRYYVKSENKIYLNEQGVITRDEVCFIGGTIEFTSNAITQYSKIKTINDSYKDVISSMNCMGWGTLS